MDYTNPLEFVAYDAFLVRIELLCVDYTLQADYCLGWTPVQGEVVKEDELAERLGAVRGTIVY